MSCLSQGSTTQGGFIRTWVAALILGGAALGAGVLAPEQMLPGWATPEQVVEADPAAEAEDTAQASAPAPPGLARAAAALPMPEQDATQTLDRLWSFVEDQTEKIEQTETFARFEEHLDRAATVIGEAELPELDLGERFGMASVAPDIGAPDSLMRDTGPVPAVSFGSALTPQDARERWGSLRARYPELSALDPALIEGRLWSVYPAHTLIATGGSTAMLREICADIRTAGTECALISIAAEDVTDHLGNKALLTPAPPAPRPAEDEHAAVAPTAAPSFTVPLPVEAPEERQAVSAPAHNPRVHRLALEDAPEDERTARVIAVGDVMMGSDHPSRHGLNARLVEGGRVERVLDRDLLAVLRAGDVGFVNLEGVLLDGGEPAKDCARCFSFRSPEYYADFLAQAGFTLASLANNHSGDFGEAGRTATVAALESVGIAAAGLNQDGVRTATQVLPSGLKVGLAAFAPNRGTVSVHDLDAAAALVADLDDTHDIVLVSVHAGAEGAAASRVPKRREIYLGEDRGDVHAFAHRMVDAGADLVLGHGPHVARGLELVNGRLVAYSLGNFWTYSGFLSWGMLGVGPVLDVTLASDGRLKEVVIHSTRQAGLGVPHLDPLGEARRFTLDRTRRDFPETYATLMRPNAPRVAARDDEIKPGLAGLWASALSLVWPVSSGAALD